MSLAPVRRWIVPVAVVLLAACGGEGAGRVDRLTASGAWARPTPPGAADGVVYLELRTDVPDELVGVSVDAAVAATASLHAGSVGVGGGGHHGGAADAGADGVATMEEVAGLPADPDEALVFEPGGNHLMLEQLARPLEAGATFTVTLAFASGRTLAVPVAVKDNPTD